MKGLAASWLFLRSALYMAWLIVTVVPYAVMVLLASVFIRGRRLYWLCVGWITLAIWGARGICGIRHRLHGWEHIEAAAAGERPVVLLSKHQSAWETLALPYLMPRPLSFVFKRELLRVPFFGWALGRLDMVHIDRSRRSEAWARVAEQGRRFLAQGNWLILFPEGTRTPRGSQGSYKNGGTRLAVDGDALVLPIAVTSGRCWPRQAFLKRPGVIDLSVGAPIETRGRRPDDVMREVEQWIEAEMRRLDPQAYPRQPTAGRPGDGPVGDACAGTGTAAYTDGP